MTALPCYLQASLAVSAMQLASREIMVSGHESGDFHPEVELAIANYYKKANARDKYLARLHRIVDRPGYGEEQSTREACVQPGTALLEKEQFAGRKYLWMAVQYGQFAGSNTASLENLVAKMRH
jgi:hypothetical protein